MPIQVLCGPNIGGIPLEQPPSRIDGEGEQAMRLLLTMKFEEVVGVWAEENDIEARAFLRLGIQPKYLTGIGNR